MDVHGGAPWDVGQEGDETLHFVDHRVGERQVVTVFVGGPVARFHHSPEFLLDLL